MSFIKRNVLALLTGALLLCGTAALSSCDKNTDSASSDVVNMLTSVDPQPDIDVAAQAAAGKVEEAEFTVGATLADIQAVYADMDNVADDVSTDDFAVVTEKRVGIDTKWSDTVTQVFIEEVDGGMVQNYYLKNGKVALIGLCGDVGTGYGFSFGGTYSADLREELGEPAREGVVQAQDKKFSPMSDECTVMVYTYGDYFVKFIFTEDCLSSLSIGLGDSAI